MFLVDWLFEKLQINLQMKVLKLSKVSKFFKAEKVSKVVLFNYKETITTTVTKHMKKVYLSFSLLLYTA